MLSSRCRYALRALSHLADSAHAPQTTEQIATATGVPLATLAKILQILSRAGIVKTQRGIGGGVELAHPPEQLAVIDVVNAFDDATSCEFFSNNLHGGRLQNRLRVVSALAKMVLEETSIAELAESGESMLHPPSVVDNLLDELASMAGIDTRSDSA